MGEDVGPSPWLPLWVVASHSILILMYIIFYNFQKRRKEKWLKAHLENVVVIDVKIGKLYTARVCRSSSRPLQKAF